MQSQIVSIMRKEKNIKSIFPFPYPEKKIGAIHSLSQRKFSTLYSTSFPIVCRLFKELQLHINALILSKLYKALYAAIEENIAKKEPLREVFKAFAIAYIQFGKENRLIWKVVFEHSPVMPLPDWYVGHTRGGILWICNHIARVFTISDEEAKQLAGSFWASIHGFCSALLHPKTDPSDTLFCPKAFHSYIEYCLDGLFKNKNYSYREDSQN